MTREYLSEICNAASVLCNYCEANECEKCIVQHLKDDAFNELEEEEGETATNWLNKVAALASFVAENWHSCPIPSYISVPDCRCWGSEKCAICIAEHAEILRK